MAVDVVPDPKIAADAAAAAKAVADAATKPVVPSVPAVDTTTKSLLADEGLSPEAAAAQAAELAALTPEGIAKSKADAAAAAAVKKDAEPVQKTTAELTVEADARAKAKEIEDAKTPEQKAADAAAAAKVIADAEAAKANTPEAIAAKKAADEAAKLAGDAAPWKLEAPTWLPKDDVDAYEKWGREQKLTKEQTQKFLTTAATRQVETYNRLFKVYDDQFTADPEFGGAKKAQSLVHAKRALKHLATPEERAILDTAPEGSHPLFLKILARAGARMSEDGFITGAPGGGEPPKTIVDKLYVNGGRGPSAT